MNNKENYNENNNGNKEEIDLLAQEVKEFLKNEEELRNFNSKMTKPCMFLGIFFWFDIILNSIIRNQINISSIIAAFCIVYIVILMFKD